LQRTIYQISGWWALETGLELAELRYRAAGWGTERRLIVVRQSVKRKTALGKTLSDEPVSSSRVALHRIQPTLSTLHGLVLAVGGAWHQDASQNRLMLSVPRRKRAWFAGLWANASAPPVIHGLQNG
jgi:hypothetical protein